MAQNCKSRAGRTGSGRRIAGRAATLVIVVVGFAWWVLPWCVPLPEALEKPTPSSVRFVTEDGSPLRMLRNADGEWKGQELRPNQIPQVLVNATLAAEDQRFFDHGGIDLIAVGRAMRDNLRAGRVVSGASTLHQQLVKITSPTGQRSLWTKAVEALKARRLNMSVSKPVVLAHYLNRVSFGNLLTGCSAACEGYFAKPLADLTPAEAAYLAALPQSPARLNPFRNPEGAKARQRHVLERMKALGMLSAEELAIAQAQPIVLKRFVGGFDAPHAVEWLRSQPDLTAEVRTSLNARLQREVEKTVSRRLEALRDRHVSHAAAVVIENTSGAVRAWVGSGDFFSKTGGQINGAWTPRSPGSALKPFTYALAFERGDTPATMVADLPVEFPTESGLYRPENYDQRFFGPMTYRQALANSLNISAVRVLDRVGGAEVLKERLETLGLSTLNEPADHYGLGLTIGNAPVRLIELANAYAALARQGEWKPWTIRAATTTSPTTQPVVDPIAAWMIADILSDDRARQLTFGIRSPLRFDFPVAVKTGTSSEFRDNWTIGFTPEFTVGVWMGNFDRSPTHGVSGVSGAALVVREIFVQLNELHELSWFDTPKDLVSVKIDPRIGRRILPSSPPARVSVQERLPADRLPPPATTRNYDNRGRALLGSEYAEWLGSRDNWMGDLVRLRPDEQAPSELEITNPVDGTRFRLDPDLPNGGRTLYLSTRRGGEVRWTCETLELRREGERWVTALAPGQHLLVVRRGADGAVARSRIVVEEEMPPAR